MCRHADLPRRKFSEGGNVSGGGNQPSAAISHAAYPPHGSIKVV
jgi:hypothetical protein